ncbi:aldehyde ferredoxin oxidoreductase family protein [bacterium]|nr:aldehyde ferredoxin oxidoreductase family protein [bacterium]
MNDGYMGQFLYVDLESQTTQKLNVPGWLKQNYVGGKGFGAKLLNDLTPQGVDPLGPDNLLMFLTGPLCSTTAPAMRTCVVCKSPATNTFLDSYVGGRFGAEIKYAGYDGIIIRGISQEPVYLWIEDERVAFRSAKKIWGSDSLTANELIKQELNSEEPTIATIGQAGENKVLFSMINCEYNRQAGRGGAGAIMGSKKLKGVAIRGTNSVNVNQPKRFLAAVKQATAEISAAGDCQALTVAGTSYSVPWSSEVGLLPYKNHSSQHDPNVRKIDDTAQDKHLFLGKSACLGCPIRCSQMGAVRTGKYAPFVTDIVEYESVAMLGSNLAISNIRDIAYLTKLCDTFGMDSISTGGVIAFAFEAMEKGLIKAPEEVALEFGSTKGAEYLIRSIALQENELGKLLGQGVKKASEQLGHNTSDYAVHVKGLEIPGWGVRGAPGMGLAYATADRGACHQRGFVIGYEHGGALYQGKPVSPHGIEQKAEIVAGEQDYLAGLDTLIKCDFGSFGISAQTYIDLLNSATGQKWPVGFIDDLGGRIWNLVRLFNIREGLDRKSDTLPKRLTHQVLEDGPQKGHRIKPEDLERMLNEYYKIRNWNTEGQPTTKCIGLYGLNEDHEFKLKEQQISLEQEDTET